MKFVHIRAIQIFDHKKKENRHNISPGKGNIFYLSDDLFANLSQSYVVNNPSIVFGLQVSPERGGHNPEEIDRKRWLSFIPFRSARNLVLPCIYAL